MPSGIYVKPNQLSIMKNINFEGKICLFSDLIDDGTPVDAIEIQPVRYFDINGDKDQVEPCEEGQEDFWSVYIHIPDNGVECIADVDSKQTAILLRDAIVKISNAWIKESD